MIKVEINHGHLTIHFAPWTRLFTRASVSVPLEAIAEVHHLDRPLSAATGMHSGLLVSGLIKLGTWTSFSGIKSLVAARRDVAGVRIVLKGRVSGFDELILSGPEVRELVTA